MLPGLQKELSDYEEELWDVRKSLAQLKRPGMMKQAGDQCKLAKMICDVQKRECGLVRAMSDVQEQIGIQKGLLQQDLELTTHVGFVFGLKNHIMNTRVIIIKECPKGMLDKMITSFVWIDGGNYRIKNINKRKDYDYLNPRKKCLKISI